MEHATRSTPLLRTLGTLFPLALLVNLLPAIKQIAHLIGQFRNCQPTPQSTNQFEEGLSRLLLEVGRIIVEWVYNSLEADDPDAVAIRLICAGITYRRRDKTPNRYVATLFGTITLMRFLYQPLERGEPSIFPLEICLGLFGGRATPALADRLAQNAVGCNEQAVLTILRRDHALHWSVDLLRDVTACVSQTLAKHSHTAQVAQLLKWLEQADASRGSRKPIVAVGRDGIFLPIRHDKEYREGAAGTVSVYDRAGWRLGTVYLGRMPEPGQPTLSSQLTALIHDVLVGWFGTMPRLAYVTDAGHHQTEYYKNVLQHMRHPHHPHQYLVWEWVIDYYHVCQYISKLAEVIFGAKNHEAHAWAAKMRKWLKYKPGGINRVLHSAAALRHRRGLAGLERDYEKAYDYLRTRIQFLDYLRYRHNHLPIGSGVTEAACKTVFTQRLKQSGMSWNIEGGQVILDLRLIHLSGIWSEVLQAHLSVIPDIQQTAQTIANAA